ncbi:oligosaccharide flippase family protein [Roseibium polysiphoniae]|uniref:lipopolysaccharide biosynthesis protein n=1 Tax=Roseibium polysiphoniae TaxID=2571221 RepID=UPI003299C077
MPSFVSASVFTLISALTSMVVGFVSSIALARILGADGAGIVAFCLWIAMTAATISDLGVPSILLRYVNRFSGRDLVGGAQPFGLKLTFQLATAVTAIAMLAYSIWFASDSEVSGHFVWAMTTLLFLAYTYSATSHAAARGRDQNPEIAKLTFFGCVLQLPGIIVGALLFGPAGGLFGHMLRYLPQALVYPKYAKTPSSSSVAVTKQMKHHGRNNWGSNLIGLLIWGRIEFLFLGYYESTTVIGYYAAGLALSGLVVQLPNQILVGLVPYLGRHHDNDDVTQINQTAQRVTRWLCFLVVPICFGGAAITAELIPLLYGEDFTPAANICALLLLFSFIAPLTQVPSAIISGRERSRFFLISTPFVGALSCISLAIVTPIYGGEGAALSRAAIHFVWLLTLGWYCWAHLSTKMVTPELLMIFLAGALCGGAAYSTLQVIDGIPGLLIAVPAGALSYFIVIRLTAALPRNELDTMMLNMPASIPGPVVRVVRVLLGLLSPKTSHPATRP